MFNGRPQRPRRTTATKLADDDDCPRRSHDSSGYPDDDCRRGAHDSSGVSQRRLPSLLFTSGIPTTIADGNPMTPPGMCFRQACLLSTASLFVVISLAPCEVGLRMPPVGNHWAEAKQLALILGGAGHSEFRVGRYSAQPSSATKSCGESSWGHPVVHKQPA